jgi:hypothetical protein
VSINQMPELFYLCAQIALNRGLAPIKDKLVSFDVGEWKVQINGCTTKQNGVPPFDALISSSDGLPYALVGPSGGVVVGSGGNEERLVTDFRREVSQ